MKVLQLSKFYPPVMGGIESVAWELTEGLYRAGIECRVLCSNQDSATVRELAPSGYEVMRVGSWGRVLSTSMAPSMPMHLRRLASRQDIVHVHMPDPMAAVAMMAAPTNARVVVHWHSDVIRQRRMLKLYEPLQSWLLRRADAIVVTSPPYAESSAVLAPWRSKVKVIPIGISDNRGSACSVQAAALRQRFGQRRIVFALGRMTYYKGFDVLIDAAAALPDDCVVLIGGHGELLEHFRSMVVRRGLADKVHLLGHVKDHELESHFEACDIFCMSSTVRAEAYGVAMLEAMMMGKPAVASDIAGSGVPWVNRHGETGLNVPPGDAAALAAALRRLVDDEPTRRRMGAAARQRYEDHFTAATMSAHVLDLYGSLARPLMTSRP
jgi:rhamnosyl/mannosyltransferase